MRTTERRLDPELEREELRRGDDRRLDRDLEREQMRRDEEREHPGGYLAWKFAEGLTIALLITLLVIGAVIAGIIALIVWAVRAAGDEGGEALALLAGMLS